MYLNPYPSHILILNILDILKKKGNPLLPRLTTLLLDIDMYIDLCTLGMVAFFTLPPLIFILNHISVMVRKGLFDLHSDNPCDCGLANLVIWMNRNQWNKDPDILNLLSQI